MTKRINQRLYNNTRDYSTSGAKRICFTQKRQGLIIKLIYEPKPTDDIYVTGLAVDQ